MQVCALKIYRQVFLKLSKNTMEESRLLVFLIFNPSKFTTYDTTVSSFTTKRQNKEMKGDTKPIFR